MKYRIVLRVNGRKLTRHVRAESEAHAHRQACIIAASQSKLSTLPLAVIATVTGSEGSSEILAIVPMGGR